MVKEIVRAARTQDFRFEFNVGFVKDRATIVGLEGDMEECSGVGGDGLGEEENGIASDHSDWEMGSDVDRFMDQVPWCLTCKGK